MSMPSCVAVDCSKTAWILVGGRLIGSPPLPLPDLVIAADGGARHAQTLARTIDLWVGDFDSSHNLECSAPRVTYPIAKDKTDGELALQAALQAGAKRLVIVGAFGGRFDHTAALMLRAITLAQQGYEVILTSGDEWGFPLVSRLNLDVPSGLTLSVLAFSALQGLTLTGVRWPLQQATIPLGTSWTISNETTGAVQASILDGYALVTVLTSDADIHCKT